MNNTQRRTRTGWISGSNSVGCELEDESIIGMAAICTARPIIHLPNNGYPNMFQWWATSNRAIRFKLRPTSNRVRRFDFSRFDSNGCDSTWDCDESRIAMQSKSEYRRFRGCAVFAWNTVQRMSSSFNILRTCLLVSRLCCYWVLFKLVLSARNNAVFISR